jgi:hypothetical protein
VKVVKGRWVIKEKDRWNLDEYYACEAPEFDKTHDQVPEKCSSCGQNPPEPLHFAFLCDFCIRNP